MKSGNPVLKEKVIRDVQDYSLDRSESMTLDGAINNTILLFVILVIAAGINWYMLKLPQYNPLAVILTGSGAFVGFIFAIATTFKPKWAPVTAPIYALLEGLFLGGISSMFESAYNGIVLQAVILTMGTFFFMLFAYKSKIIQATERFKIGVIAATGGIFFLYLISFILGLFHISVPYIHSSGTFGILFSVFVVVIAALNLILDFDLIEQSVARRLPKFMEWYGAFALMVTIVWLYIEILQLLAKLNRR